MRINLTLQHNTHNLLPFDYPAKVQAWIYAVLWNADPEFAQWLHNQGYRAEGGKNFKLFTFSRWHCIPPFERHGSNGLLLKNDTSEITLSFCMPQDGHRFVQGIFKKQSGYISTANSAWDFQVQNVTVLPEPQWQETITYHAVTPIVIARRKRQEEKYEAYVMLDNPERAALNLAPFKKLLLQNLWHKAKTIHPNIPETPTNVKLLSQAQSKLVTIKGMRIKGQLFEFELTAPKVLHQVGYYAGFGKNTSMGFGFCNIKANNT